MWEEYRASVGSLRVAGTSTLCGLIIRSLPESLPDNLCHDVQVMGFTTVRSSGPFVVILRADLEHASY